jgi:hypothetical protein
VLNKLSIGNVLSDPPLVVSSQGRNVSDQLVNSDLPPPKIYQIETTSVMAVLNAIALTNVDPFNTLNRETDPNQRCYHVLH